MLAGWELGWELGLGSLLFMFANHILVEFYS
jgi:hypothetical protein